MNAIDATNARGTRAFASTARVGWKRHRARGRSTRARGTARGRERDGCARGALDALRDATRRDGGASEGLVCDVSAGKPALGNGVRNVFPVPLSIAHDEAFERRLSALGATANGTEDVLEALKRRRAEGSKPGSRGDGLKIGLVVEGGGMRGCISAGAVGALLDEGYYDCFDAAYGSSAGAMNLTYYLAKQPEGVRAYEQDLCDGTFLDLKRHLARRLTVIKEAHVDLVRPIVRFGRRSQKSIAARNGANTIEEATMADVATLAENLVVASEEAAADAKYSVDPAMNVHFLLDRVMGGETGKPLNWDNVINAPVPLKVVATSLDTMTTVILEDFKDEQDLKKCLLASARVPALAGASPVVHRGHRLVDAAVLEPVPVHAAVHDDCTHVLVLLTAAHKTDTEADARNVETRDNRRFLGRIRDRLRRIARRPKARQVATAAASEESVSALNKSIDDPVMKPKPAQSALYRAIRNLLFAPSYMGPIWRLHDAFANELQTRHGWRARDVFVPSTAKNAFHPIKITTIAPDGPASRAMSPLCVDPELIAAARVEGAAATLRALAGCDDITALERAR